MSYSYDVFLSYPRKGFSGEWVRNHFYDLLVGYLNDELAHEPRVYYDAQQPVGVDWPEHLREALLTSKVLVAVWSPPYFRSDWCVAEWHSMRQRQIQLHHENPGVAHRLVFPVVFNDGQTFPAEAQATQWADLSEWSYHTEEFRRTTAYIDFLKNMRSVARDVAALVVNAPEWRPDWPVRTPPPPAPPAFPMPRL